MSLLYEDEESLQAEYLVGSRAAALESCEFEKFPLWGTTRSHQIDGQFVNPVTGGLKRLVEIKCRSHRIGEYVTYMIDREKIRMGLVWSSLTREPFSIIVQWENCCGGLTITKDLAKADVRRGGRTDRDDKHDVEMLCHFPVELFKVLWKGQCYA